MNNNVLFLFIILLCINSCSLLQTKKKFLTESNSSQKNTNLIFLNFKNAVEKIVFEIFSDNSIFFSKKISLYINILRNKSNIFLENKKLTNIIQTQILRKTNKFHIINSNQIKYTKKKLGLSEDNKYLNTNIAILLARNNHATYYLDSKIIRKHQFLVLTVKLILVKTGEIIFQKTKNLYFLSDTY